jgi:hypothetical protein
LATKPRTFPFSFHWPPSQEPSPSPSIGHQAKNLLLLLPLTTKPRTFTLSLKDELGSWERFLFFFPEKQFQLNLESVCFDKFLEEEMKDQLWSWREEGE